MDLFMSAVQKFGSAVLQLLPASPFQPFLDGLRGIPYLGYLNWFIPVGTFVKIGTAWLGSIALFYLYSIILRWIKVIGD